MFLALSVVDEKLKTSGGDAKLLLQTFIVNATLSRSHVPAGVAG
jgi:hypothetical protein